MTLRVIGTIGTFFLVFFGLMSMVGDVSVADFFALLGFGCIAGLIAWYKLFKPGAQR
ncbi:hypothetical protein LCGC14_1261220 [marine sediment metagenome]|uniref:Uncharacterized protein n=1 Tax=marine sediment metagenome TaxID=412755 RepID=A0A0F9L338_9ZZZZ